MFMSILKLLINEFHFWNIFIDYLSCLDDGGSVDQLFSAEILLSPPFPIVPRGGGARIGYFTAPRFFLTIIIFTFVRRRHQLVHGAP